MLNNVNYLLTKLNHNSKDKKYRFYIGKKALNKKVVAKNYFKKGTNYIKVRPYSKVNGKFVYGPWSGVKTVKR